MGNFYSRTLDKELRFGDVLQWGVSTPSFYKNKSNLENKDFFIKVCYTSHSVILTPCCTIGKQSKITLAPLVQVRNSFFSNPYFVEDLTRINRILEEPEKSVSPEIWKKMPPKKEMKFLKKPYAFEFLFMNLIHYSHLMKLMLRMVPNIKQIIIWLILLIPIK